MVWGFGVQGLGSGVKGVRWLVVCGVVFVVCFGLCCFQLDFVFLFSCWVHVAGVDFSHDFNYTHLYSQRRRMFIAHICCCFTDWSPSYVFAS